MTHSDQVNVPKLREYQEVGRDFLASRNRSLLYDEPGVGKTPQACAAIAKLDRPAIVVCPAVAVGVWQHELAVWASEFEVRTQTSTKPVDSPTGRQVLVTTYDRVRLNPGVHRCGVVLDEGHLVKTFQRRRAESKNSQRGQRVAELLDQTRSYAWELTGTPIMRYPDDLWGQLSVLGIERQTYRTKAEFARQFGGEYGVDGLIWNAKRQLATAWDPLQHFMLRRLRSEVLKLPARTREEWYVELPKRLAARFANIAERYPPDHPTWENPDFSGGGELQQALADMAAVKAEGCLSGIRELDSTPDNPLVVFASHRDAAHIVAHELGWPCIDGDTSSDRRTALAHAFQHGEYAGICGTIHACGTALTLTRAKTILFIGETYTPALNDQAADRVYRFGQEREVRAIYARADSPLEKNLQRVLTRKRPFGAIPSSEIHQSER